MSRVLEHRLVVHLGSAGLAPGEIEALLNLALGPASAADLGRNARLLPGELPVALLAALVARGLAVPGPAGDPRHHLAGADSLRRALPPEAAERLVHLVGVMAQDFLPGVVPHPAPPADPLPAPYLEYAAAFRARLPQVEVRLQTACNLACRYCFIRRDAHDAASTDAALGAIEHARAGGGQRLILTGGEPTLRPDLPRLVRRARDLGFEDVQVFTNGLMLAYPDRARALVDAGLGSLCLHVSTLDRETYAAVAGRDLLPVLRQAMDQLAQFPSLEVTVLTVVSRATLPGLARTVAALRAWQAAAGFRRFVSQLILCCVYGSAWDHRDDLLLSMTEAAPRVAEVVRAAARDPWPVVHQGFPPCLMPGLEAHSYDLYLTLGRRLLPGGVDDVTELEAMFVKPDPCLGCRHEPWCLGLPRGYVRRFGAGEVRPRPSSC